MFPNSQRCSPTWHSIQHVASKLTLQEAIGLVCSRALLPLCNSLLVLPLLAGGFFKSVPTELSTLR